MISRLKLLTAACMCLVTLPQFAAAQTPSLDRRLLRELNRPTVPPPVLNAEVLASRERRWDFEDGTLQGFVHEDVAAGATGAFHNQPTFGDNVSASRALNTRDLRLPRNPCAGLVLDEATTCEFGPGATFFYLDRLRNDLNRLRGDLDTIGGGYSDTAFPIGKQGLYWIGTYEARPSRRIGSTPGRAAPRPTAWGTTQGDRRTGRLVSPEIELHHKYFHFLVGGGCSNEVGVYLQAFQARIEGDIENIANINAPGSVMLERRRRTAPRAITALDTLKDAGGRPIAARGYCIENMVRVSFNIEHLAGTKARIVIEDRATGSWGHINVDDIHLSNRPPQGNSRDTDPVWGVADLHAHLMNEFGFTAYDSNGRVPEARVLWGSAMGPIEALQGCNDTHTTNDFNFNSHFDEAFGSTYTLCRDACLNLIEGAGLPDLPGDQLSQDGVLGGYHNTRRSGYPFFVNWPMWYSSIHQQMHWSWVQRAYRGGLRMMIASVGNSEVLSFALAKEKDRTFTSDQDALAMQIPAIKEFARQNASWTEVAYTPRDARRIINSGKLALVIGIELDHVMDSCNADVTTSRHHTAREYAHPDVWASQNGIDIGVGGTITGISQFIGASTRVMNYPDHPRSCTDAQIDARLDALYREGVRQIIPMHFSDNMLGGYAINGDLFLASAIFGSPGARFPNLMQQTELSRLYGARVEPFEPVAREAYVGENARRREQWQNSLPFSFKLSEATVPIWAKLGPETIADPEVLPPGIGRTIAEFFTGECIEDDGWRVAFGVLTGGLTEAACATTALTHEIFESARSTMPYEGATDSPAMIPLNLNADQNALPFHINARGLTPNGASFIRAMVRRGMLIDVQHASEKAKTDILSVTGAYPLMASHGGLQTGRSRGNENVLSTSQLEHIYSPPNGFTGGVVGLGVQSSAALVDQIDTVFGREGVSDAQRELLLQTRGVAIGTDLNGIDWHAAPRFGRFAYYHDDTPQERAARRASGRIGPMVNYTSYPSGTNPWSATTPTCNPACPTWVTTPQRHRPLNALQITTRSGNVTRTFDINYDGLAHYGMIPDFLQEVSILGVTREEMGAVFRSSESTIRMWEESCFLAYQQRNQPRSLTVGCGPRSLYDN